MQKKHFLTTSIIASSILLFGLSGCAETPASPQGQSSTQQRTETPQPSASELPYAEYFKHEVFQLDNGLTVLVHEDKSKSNVAVAVTFHVGSKNEPAGKSGFAHVFEHLAFNGTKRNPGEYFKYLDEIGASSANGSTGNDYTNYYQVAPRTSLERLLWLEADRMMNVGTDASQKSLDTQIDVIINEKRLGENQPFGQTGDMAAATIYPAGHPYAHRVIGSETDLKGATLEDVKAWYKTYYGASNALLVLAGNISPDEGRALAEQYFGHVPAGPSLTKMAEWHVKRDNITVQKNYDISPVSELTRNYSLPKINSPEDTANAMVFMTLGQGETSFLRKHLVEDLGVAVEVSAGVSPRELDTRAYITVYPADGVSLEALDKHLNEAINLFMKEGPDATDIENIYGQMRSNLVYSSDDITAKAVIMGADYYQNSDPLFRLKYTEWVRTSTPEAIQKAANDILPFGYHEERNYAQEERVAAQAPATLDVAPLLGTAEGISIPDPDTFKLGNGLEVVLVNRPASPLIAMDLVVPLGSDNLSPMDEEKMQTAMEFAMKGGAGGLSKEQQTTKLASMGSSFNAYLRDTSATYSVSTDSIVLDDILGLFAKVVHETEFAEDDFQDFMQKKIEVTKVSDKYLPETGNDILDAAFLGTENAISNKDKLAVYPDYDRGELETMFKNWLKPDGSRLYISGDLEVEEAKEKLTKYFSKWDGSLPEKKRVLRTFPAAPNRPKFLLLNNEGSDQTAIGARRKLTPMPSGDNYIVKMANKIMGGSFTSRLNTNLREDKGWTYGIRHSLSEGEQLDAARISASVTDVHTVDAIKEIIKELDAVRTSRPITKTELSDLVTKDVGSFSTEDNYSVLRVLKRSDSYNQDYDYYERLADRYNGVSVGDINAAAKDIFRADDFVWVLVGDLDSFEAELRKANLGDIEVYDAEGKFLR